MIQIDKILTISHFSFFKKLLCCVFFLFYFNFISYSQSVLEANGPGNTYELINSVLAPGYTAVEAPDQCTSHPSFGRHVAEVFDAFLNQYVFEFYIHVPTGFPVTATTADNDRCLNFDRQRVEIKTYESSPDSLKGTIGETITYKWKFRLPSGFQPSPNFTHIHQLKAVGGDEGDPIFTLTVRYGSGGNTLQLLHVIDSSTAATTLASATLSSFLGTWVEVKEQVKVGANGTYSISINRVSDGANLLSYSNSNILTIRPTNTFTRPKWGIYRSLNSPSYLRDDSIRLAGISIYEGLTPAAPNNLVATAISTSQINLSWNDNSNNERVFVVEKSANGISGWITAFTTGTNATSFADIGLASNTTYYYRIKADNPAGSSSYSNIVSATTFQIVPVQLINFKASLINKCAVITWDAMNEINFKEYQVQWSSDGVNYLAVTTLPAKGLNAISSYSYQFSNLISGNNYYKLKMIDKDGSYQYSSVVTVFYAKTNEVTIFPNPTKDFVTVYIGGTTSNTIITIRLLDNSGKECYKTNYVTSLNTIDIRNLRKGLYLIKVIGKDKLSTSYPLLIN
jgi:hypothetical protein